MREQRGPECPGEGGFIDSVKDGKAEGLLGLSAELGSLVVGCLLAQHAEYCRGPGSPQALMERSPSFPISHGLVCFLFG